MFAIVTHLYPKSRLLATLLFAIFMSCSFPAQAQRPELRRPHEEQPTAPPAPTPKKSKARAIGVVEFLSGGGIRLVPVALWWEGKYYDASLYEANPAPLAVEPGTVYQALNDGEPAGTFVVSMPKLSNAGWIGDGRWSPYRPMDAKLAAEAAKQPRPKEGKAIFTSGSDEGPPVLRRPADENSGDKSSAPVPAAPAQPSPGTQPASSSSTTTSEPSTTTSDSANGRPTLHRPNDQPEPTPVATAQQASSPSIDDSDRPILRKPSEPPQNATSAAPGASSPAVDENDPNRPLLTRGEKPPASQPAPKFPVSGSATPAHTAAAKKSSAPRSFAAISDAAKFETRSLVYTTTPERQQQLAQSMLDLALTGMRGFAKKYTSSPPLPKDAVIKDYDLRFFDLDFSNSPTLVLTAKLPIPTAGSKPFIYYATVVARLDINGDPVKVFNSVTDTTHLDVFPRLELVDALDADGNGRGDLLFRQYSDRTINYGLYRVFPYNMEKVFEGGSSV